MGKTANAPVEETALAQLGEYAITQISPQELGEIMEDNLGGSQIGMSDLERVKAPSGGAMFFQRLDDESGKMKPHETIQGVIVYWRDGRAFWPTSQEEGQGAPPSCVGSFVEIDSVGSRKWIGKGDRDGDGFLGANGYHDCSECQYNEFGSAQGKNGEKGRGKACKETRLLAILEPGKLLPTLINVPPTSLRLVKSYFIGLLNNRTSYAKVVTEIGLSAEKNKSNIDYAALTFRKVANLGPADQVYVNEYVAKIRPSLERVETLDSAKEKETEGAFAGQSGGPGPAADGEDLKSANAESYEDVE